MKITLEIDEGILRRLVQEAERHAKSTSELVEMAIRAYLRDSTVRAELPPLPVMRGGGELVDVADRKALDALYD